MDLSTRLTSTDQRSRGRACFLLRVRAERVDDYVEAHRHVWDESRGAPARVG